MTTLFCWKDLAFERKRLSTTPIAPLPSLGLLFWGISLGWDTKQHSSAHPQHPELAHRNRYQTPPARNQHAQIPCRAFFHPSPDIYLHKTEKGNTESSTTHFCFGIAKSSSWRKFAMSLWNCITAVHTWIFSTGRCYKGSQPYGQLQRIQINIFSSLIVNFSFPKIVLASAQSVLVFSATLNYSRLK